MKGMTLTACVVGAVIALIAVSTAAGLETDESGNGYEMEEMLDDGLVDEFLEDNRNGSFDGDLDPYAGTDPSTDPPFSGLARRVYHYLTVDFISKHSNWEELPSVKTIFTANSSGEWMYDALPRINATGEARIVDRNGDGIAELVIWHHHNRSANLSYAEVNISNLEAELSDDHLSKLQSSTYGMYGGFTLYYLDKDGDKIPETIILRVIRKVYTDLNPDGSFEFQKGFSWTGTVLDLDDDGDREYEGFGTSKHTWMDLNGDGCTEIRTTEKADYRRADLFGRPLYDSIHARISRSRYFDRDSDGSPEFSTSYSLAGIWKDDDGNGSPDHFGINMNRFRAHDSDSDGFPEVTLKARTTLAYYDRNGDRNPELVKFHRKGITVWDRDSDGRWDLMMIKTALFKWIDRNSDGIPEKVLREDRTEYRTPDRNRPERRHDNTEDSEITRKDQERNSENSNVIEEKQQDRPVTDRAGNKGSVEVNDQSL
ncbi:MAG: hypothetical protein ACMUIE_01885 [Thermoplasmatota archaeon]